MQTYIQRFLSSSWEENTKLSRELLSNILFFFVSLHCRKQWKTPWKMHFPVFKKGTISNFSHPSAPTMGSLWESLNITYLTVCNSIQQYAQKIPGYSTVTILVHDMINLLYYSQGGSNSQIFHGKCNFPNFAICRTSQFMFSEYLQTTKI